MQKLFYDCETYSATHIRNGMYRYAADAEIMLVSYAIDDSPVQCWDLTLGGACPADLAEALVTTPEVWAHNAMFDRAVLRLGKNAGCFGVACPEISRWRCSMVQALCHGLPGGLDFLGRVMGLPDGQIKHAGGRELVLLFCKPRFKSSKIRRATRETHPEQWQKFIEYAIADVEAAREVHKRLPTWNYPDRELATWHLDQTINDRGFRVDRELVSAAIETVKLEQARLKTEVAKSTEGDVVSASQGAAMLAHVLEAYGVHLPNLQKDTLKRLLGESNLDPDLRELLLLRLQASATSTAKYNALAKAVSADGRCRGTIQFAGAARTMRPAGRTFQPQNLPSKGLLPPEEVDLGIEAMKLGVAPLIYDNVTHLAVSAVRGCLVPKPGCKFVISDLSNIEGRVAAWVSDETWKVGAFRAFDAGTGHDLYVLAYANSFKVDPSTVTHAQRQIGKVQELMLQYAGGVGAFVKGAASYGFDLEELADTVWDTLPVAVRDEATSYYGWVLDKGNSTYGLSEKAFVACDTLKRLWRESHPAITALWSRLEEAVKAAIARPGRTLPCGRLRVRVDGAWLRIQLPSGRYICYPEPALNAEGITYKGPDIFTHKWGPIKTYGGKLFENVCQAIARDILYAQMPLVEATGYGIVLHVYDELVVEAPDMPEYSAEALSMLLAAPLSWSEGLPLAAAGFEAYRYRKG